MVEPTSVRVHRHVRDQHGGLGDDAAGQLPAEVTSFVGRRREVAAVKRMLADSRCVTLTGAGGVGKTRLAVRSASDVQDSSFREQGFRKQGFREQGFQGRGFRDGVWFVELAELREPTLLPAVVSEVLKLHDQSPRSATDSILQHLGEREVLLVLDSCEHLIGACARLVDALIRFCPHVHVIVTSRQSLGIPGETTVTVSPLGLPPVPDADWPPSPESLLQYPAVRLFVDRVRAILPEYELPEADAAILARLVSSVDGIPLALELAAVQMRSLSLRQIEDRLSSVQSLQASGRSQRQPQRHQTLRHLINGSFQLCTEHERLFWARASVFVGSFDVDAAEHVVVDDWYLPADEVLALIDSLVDKSILIREEHGQATRYRMLEMLREFGQEKLASTGDRSHVRRRHRDWYASRTEAFAAEWIGPEQASWIDVLRRELPNVRTALEFCSTQADQAPVALRMVVNLDDYWGVRGLRAEARHWLDQALLSTPIDAQERVSALRVNGWYALFQGDTQTGGERLAEAADQAERRGDVVESGYVAHIQGIGALFVGDSSAAVGTLGSALARFQEAGHLRGILFTTCVYAIGTGLEGDQERARALLEECISQCRRHGDMYWRSYALWGLAYIEVSQGDLDRAEDAATSALRLQEPLDNMQGMALSFETLAWIAQRRMQHDRAAALFGVAERVWREVGAQPDNYVLVGQQHHEHTEGARAALGDDAYNQACWRGGALSMSSAIDYALERSA